MGSQSSRLRGIGRYPQRFTAALGPLGCGFYKRSYSLPRQSCLSAVFNLTGQTFVQQLLSSWSKRLLKLHEAFAVGVVDPRKCVDCGTYNELGGSPAKKPYSTIIYRLH